MRSADDNLVPSDKDLENLLRKVQKSAAKNEAYKKRLSSTTDQLLPGS